MDTASSPGASAGAGNILTQLGTLAANDLALVKKAIDALQPAAAPAPQPSGNGFLDDQKGGRSSKRFWAFAFGWTTVFQVVALLTLIFLSAVFQWSAPQGYLPFIQYTLTTTGALSAVCLGLTLPEWFAPK